VKDLQENFLCQVFCLGNVLGHQQTHGIDALPVKLEERGKGLFIVTLCALNQAAFIFEIVLFLS
jgi:hypothetical protein